MAPGCLVIEDLLRGRGDSADVVGGARVLSLKAPLLMLGEQSC